MALYETTEGGVRNTITNQHIPDSMDNQDWVGYQVWLNDGNTPDPIVVQLAPTLDEEYDSLSDWMKELIVISGANLAALKAQVAARRVP